MALFLRLTAYPASVRDPELFRAVARRVNLLDPADALGRNAALVERALELVAEGGPPPAAAPPREALLETIAPALR
jgi:hypothetical protein